MNLSIPVSTFKLISKNAMGNPQPNAILPVGKYLFTVNRHQTDIYWDVTGVVTPDMEQVLVW